MELNDYFKCYLKYLCQKINRRKKILQQTDNFIIACFFRGYNRTIQKDGELEKLYLEADKIATQILKNNHKHL